MGELLPEEIDEYIDMWHESTTEIGLHEFLGMTEKEYALWVAKPKILPFIIKAHHDNSTISAILKAHETLRLAARKEGIDNISDIIEWLKKENLWN